MTASLPPHAGDVHVPRSAHLSLDSTDFVQSGLAGSRPCDPGLFSYHVVDCVLGPPKRLGRLSFFGNLHVAYICDPLRDVGDSDVYLCHPWRISLIRPVADQHQMRRQRAAGRDRQHKAQGFCARSRHLQFQVGECVHSLIAWRGGFQRACRSFVRLSEPRVLLNRFVFFAGQFAVHDKLGAGLPNLPSAGRFYARDHRGGRARVQHVDRDHMPARPRRVLFQNDLGDQVGALQGLSGGSRCVDRSKARYAADDQSAKRNDLGKPELHAFVLSSAGRVERRVGFGDPARHKSWPNGRRLSMLHSLARLSIIKDAA